MRISRLLLVSSALAASASVSTPTMAGGFQRGVADTDMLFEKGNFATRYGLTYVDPNRGFSSINGQDGDFGDYTGKYNIPSASVYFGGDSFGCAGTFTISFAAEADYDGGLPRQRSANANGTPVGTDNDDRRNLVGAASTSSTVGTEFSSNEFGATCRASYETENSRFSLLGGVFFEDFQFDGQSAGERNLNGAVSANPTVRGILGLTGATIVLPSAVDVDSNGDYQAGYRIGFAYEIPEIALRAQVMYRSEVEHDDIGGDGSVTITDSAYVRLADGTQTTIPTFFRAFDPSGRLGGAVGAGVGAAAPAPGTVIPIQSFLSDSTSPQSITVNAQTGIAPGTLLLGSFRWTDWSTNDAVVSTITGTATGTSSSYAPYNWDDGYTASIGIGRAFNDQISGAISIGYDSGVSTGSETTYTDLYTLSGGVSLKPMPGGEIRFGGLVGYWTEGEQRVEDGAFFDATVDDTIVYAANVSLKLTF